LFKLEFNRIVFFEKVRL